MDEALRALINNVFWIEKREQQILEELTKVNKRLDMIEQRLGWKDIKPSRKNNKQ